MYRLTKRSATGTAVPISTDICMQLTICDNYDFCEWCPIGRMINKLADYEDTGLTPKQIAVIKKFRQHQKMSAEKYSRYPKEYLRIVKIRTLS